MATNLMGSFPFPGPGAKRKGRTGMGGGDTMLSTPLG